LSWSSEEVYHDGNDHGPYGELASPYVPSPTEGGEMSGLVAELQTSSKIVESSMVLYD